MSIRGIIFPIKRPIVKKILQVAAVLTLISGIIFSGGLFLGLPREARAVDGSGTNTVSPASADSGSSGNTFTFTFTAAEEMHSGKVRITVPAGWSAPQGTSGTAGYTIASAGAGATVADPGTEITMESAAGWQEEDGQTDVCNTGAGVPELDSAIFKEGANSIKCDNTGNIGPDLNDAWGYVYGTAQDWSSYTTAGVWFRSTADVTATGVIGLNFYSDNLNTALAGGSFDVFTLNGAPLSADTWYFLTIDISGMTRTAVKGWGLQALSSSGLDNKATYLDDFLLGPGNPTFTGAGPWDVTVRILDLDNTETITVTYGSGGGASGVTAPTVGTNTDYTFTTASQVSANGTLNGIAVSPIITVLFFTDNITVGTEGAQTVNMAIPSSNNNVGGAFTFVRNTGSANVTQIIISDTGTVNANLNLSDAVVFYKQEVSCSASIPGDAAQFNSVGAGFNASEKATVTGTMAVGTSQICVYVRLDVGSAASNGETIEIEITNPSTEVTVSAGSVIPATPVAISGITTLQGASFTSYGISFLYTSANWGSVNFYLEVYMRATSGTVHARLFNETDGVAVSGSVLSTASTSFQRLRSGSLTLTDGKVYRVQFGKAGADAGETLGAKLIGF